MTAEDRRRVLKGLFLDYPSWHASSALPVLISLANTIDQAHYKAAVTALLAGDGIDLEASSHHHVLHLLEILRGLSWTTEEIMRAIDKAETIPSEAKSLPRTALRIAYSGGAPGPETLSLLEMIARRLDAV